MKQVTTKLLKVVSTKLKLDGKCCRYIVDGEAGTVNFDDNGLGDCLFSGVIHRRDLDRFIEELREIAVILDEGAKP